MAKESAYLKVKQIAFEGQQYRSDIGHLAIRSTTAPLPDLPVGKT
jgi:phosphoribosylamine-glycine ligase